MIRQITKDELLNMPASSYMNLEQLDFFDRLITAEIKSTYSAMGNVTSELYESTDNSPDIIDQANRVNELFLKEETIKKYKNRIRNLESALKRLKDGDYGYCEYSGDEIGLKRLLINPATNLSVEAQERKEFEAKQYYS